MTLGELKQEKTKMRLSQDGDKRKKPEKTKMGHTGQESGVEILASSRPTSCAHTHHADRTHQRREVKAPTPAQVLNADEREIAVCVMAVRVRVKASVRVCICLNGYMSQRFQLRACVCVRARGSGFGEGCKRGGGSVCHVAKHFVPRALQRVIKVMRRFRCRALPPPPNKQTKKPVRTAQPS
eukprot:3428546-Rhodomonas_salina.1